MLWPDQAIALQEIEWYGGIAGGLRVSGGKSTISFLAATMLPDCPRPLLICPSKSIKTGKILDVYNEERKRWRVRDDYSWISYHDLQSDNGADYLANTKPGLLILDEAHHAGRYDSSRTKRIERYLAAHPDVPVIVLTGSLIASRIVNDSLVLLDWARREHSPLPGPSAKATQRFWKLALDVPQRTDAGVLRTWCKPGEPSVVGVGRRYYETPGVVCSRGENNIGASLTCSTHLVTSLATPVLEAFDNLRLGKHVDGSELLDSDGSNTWLTAQTLALGFYYVDDPKPPSDWLDAYRNWCAYCREHIQDSGCDCDTEKRVKQHLHAAAADGEGECWALADWELVQHNHKRKSKAVWLSRDRLRAACKWMDGHKHGMVWSQFKGFSQALALESGRPYYGANARDSTSRKYITQHPRGQPCIASIKTCSEDLNLQHTFFQNLFVSPPATGAWHEQAIARTHRFGTREAEITVDYWVACAEQRDALSVGRQRERAAAQMTGDFNRKLLIADWYPHKPQKVEGPQWASKKIARSLMK